MLLTSAEAQSAAIAIGGVRLPCRVFGAPRARRAESVFTTAHSGYVESCTDPSYDCQALVFSHPVVGAHGVPTRAMQSSGFWPAFVVAAQPSADFIKWALSIGGCVAQCSHTRQLVELSRHGSIAELIGVSETRDPLVWRASASPASAADVTLVDFGCKQSLADAVRARGLSVSIVSPLDFSHVKSPRGVLLSSGPGDPRADRLGATVAARAVESGAPVLGVCYGHQLLCIAAGLSVSKLRVGHRGANHPVLSNRDSAVIVTSHNHGFAVDEPSQSSAVSVTHVSLLDGSVEGVTSQGFTSVQFHPEGHPGPTVDPVIDSFCASVRSRLAAQE